METRADIIGALLLIVTTVSAMIPESNAAVQVAASNTSYRLPKTIKPVSYEVYLKPYIDSFTYDGYVRIKVLVLEDTSNITLHSNRHTITNIMVTDNNTITLDISNTTNPEKHFLTINSETLFLTVSEYDIHINFTGVLSEDMNGFYRSSYTIDNKTR
jgi:hypothetical protein